MKGSLLIRWLPAGALATMVLASSASAATVRATSSSRPGDNMPEQRLTVVYESAGAVSDRVRMTVSGAGVRLRQRGSSLTPGPGCSGAATGSVLCARGPRCECSDRFFLVLAAGAGDDDVRVTNGPFGRSDSTSTVVRIDGGAGADVLKSRSARERDAPRLSGTLVGGPGDDRLAGAMELYGGAGDDRLTGGELKLFGGGGRDRLRAIDGRFDGDGPNQPGGRPAIPASDRIEGLGTRDTVVYSTRRAPVTVDLSRHLGGQHEEHDELDGIDRVEAGHGDDLLIGDRGPNSLYGDRGRDRLLGGAGNDILEGGPTTLADVLHGGSGDDRLGAIGPGSSCGAGLDVVAADPPLREAVPSDCESIDLSDSWDVEDELAPHDAVLRGRTVTVPLSSDAVLRAGWDSGPALARARASGQEPLQFRLTARGAALVRRSTGRVTLEVTVWKCCDEDESEYDVVYRVPIRVRIE